MKKTISLLLCLLAANLLQAKTKTVHLKFAGSLSAVLSSELTSITNLTVTGNIDARDFKTMRLQMGLLDSIDLSGARIIKYDDTYTSYAADAVPRYALNDITYLKSFIFPASVTSIGYCAFSECSWLTGLSIPASVTFIGNEAFHGCSGLTGLSIPSSVTSIGIQAFSYCRGLTGTLTIPASVTSIGSEAFYNCSGLTGLSIPASVTSIYANTFYLCSGLTGTLTIPASVTSIGYGAFTGCSGLTGLTIPASVTSIGASAFNSCSGLTEIKAYSKTPVDLTANSDVFFNVNKTSCTLRVPAGSKVLYRAAAQWKDFINIEEMAPIVIATALPMDACPGSAVKLTVTADGVLNNSYSYTWSTGTATTPEITVNPTQTTTYYVTVADANGGKQTSSVTVTVKDVAPAPESPTVSDVSVIYNGSSQSASAATTAGNTVNIYDAALGGNLLVSGTATATSTPAQVNAGAYTYYAEARNTNTGCVSPARVAATVTIIPKSLTITAPAIASKVYDGTAQAGTVTIGTVSGLIGTETIVVTGTAADYSSKNTGSYVGTTVIYSLTNGTGSAANYSLSDGTATGTVTAKPLTVTASGNDKVYDGSATATVTLNSDAFAGDKVTPEYTIAIFSDETVGNDKLVNVSGITLSGTDAGNYTCNTTATAQADITMPNGTSTPSDGGAKFINTVEVSPNPFLNEVKFSASGKLTGATYTINTQDGTVAASGSICNGTATANLSHLPVGIYIVRLHTPTGTTSQMILKQ